MLVAATDSNVSFNGTVVQSFLERVCLSNGDHLMLKLEQSHRGLYR